MAQYFEPLYDERKRGVGEMVDRRRDEFRDEITLKFADGSRSTFTFRSVRPAQKVNAFVKK